MIVKLVESQNFFTLGTPSSKSVKIASMLWNVTALHKYQFTVINSSNSFTMKVNVVATVY